jgi:NADPH:quinone reductase-like Zn-dependent oxidoreductase
VKAAVCDRYGTPDVVRIEEIDKPESGAGEILVRVHAASVNRADLDGIQPRPQFIRLFFGFRGPRNHSVGIDVAGTVEAVGPGVTRFKPGDRVFSDLFGNPLGAFAEYTVAPESKFEPIIEGMSFDDAATLPHSAVLALQGLRRDGRTVGAGDKVLIVGASGNVGPFAVQIAKGWVPKSPAWPAAPSSSSSGPSGRITSSTTGRPIGRRPARATTGSWTPTRMCRSGVRGVPSRRAVRT